MLLPCFSFCDFPHKLFALGRLPKELSCLTPFGWSTMTQYFDAEVPELHATWPRRGPSRRKQGARRRGRHDQIPFPHAQIFNLRQAQTAMKFASVMNFALVASMVKGFILAPVTKGRLPFSHVCVRTRHPALATVVTTPVIYTLRFDSRVWD